MARGLTPIRLRLYLLGLLIAVLIPTAVLIQQTQRQLRWEALHQHQEQAAALTEGIDRRLRLAISNEEARSSADYQFLISASQGSYQRLSALSAFPVSSQLPGLIGYFQIDGQGQFSTPLLPASMAGQTISELDQRLQLRDVLLDVLSRNSLVERRRLASPEVDALAYSDDDAAELSGSADYGVSVGKLEQEKLPVERKLEEAASAPSQIAFDRLSEQSRKKDSMRAAQSKKGRLDKAPSPETANRQAIRPAEAPAALKDEIQSEDRRGRRKEQIAMLSEPKSPAPRIELFESELDPFEFARLESGHFVLFRKVWRKGGRLIQGALIDQTTFIAEALAAPYQASRLPQSSRLVVSFQGIPLAEFPGQVRRDGVMAGQTLHRSRLPAPLAELELDLELRDLPAPAGRRLVNWAAGVLGLILLIGLLIIDRLGLRQIRLARQQQDFISAVSHELKTPLTSIRMYGEMLREGWVQDDKRQEYYNFIHDEAERLSRLISNVLQLARMDRNDLQLSASPCRLDALADILRSRIAPAIERSGFTLDWDLSDECAPLMISVDADAYTQIMINLVDNGLKFSAGAQRRELQIGLRRSGPGHICWWVRDYGPGIPRDEMKKIFELFYRPGSELTRDTVGTGIGLALVRQLSSAMGGQIDAHNANPGARFELRFPLSDHD